MRTARLTGDKIFLDLLLFTLFGTLMIYNATVVFAQNNFGEAYRFVFCILMGNCWIVGVFSFYNLDYKNFTT